MAKTDFLTEQQIIFNTSKKFEDVYIKLNDIADIKYQELFILCATIGFKNNRSNKVEKKGRELRSAYLNSDQKSSAYSIILNENNIGKNIEKFEEKEFVFLAKKTLEEYAEGGMELLIKEAFPTKFNFEDEKLELRYDEYIIDIMSYVYRESTEVPF
ncbi:hypothetical protein Z957_09565 [Clostridium sp. K25]|uniref:hypothetical protein n=1 Tax=Clostridium sp. K25 TaxID=1443109 RepID=UPI0004D7800E|nr:hypothetical protein [Clostridium sp. K25]KEI07164.1 hypothetical protein Z957_09565 [Clostridium sp. K25]